MGKGRNQKNRNNDKKHANMHQEESFLTEARKLKQQAERKANGPERIPALERCCYLYNQSLTMPLPPSEKEDVLFDLGEVYMLWSNAVKKGAFIADLRAFKVTAKKNPVVESKLETLICSADLCRKSTEAYKMAFSIDGGHLKREALINCANALCDWAEILCDIPHDIGGGITPATGLYSEAMRMYSKAKEMEPADVEVLTNMGDCCIKISELMLTSINLESANVSDVMQSARECYNQAFNAYSDACSKADMKLGDDVTGLLQNWGAGLLSFAKHSTNMEEAMEAFNHAKEKLQNAASFCLTDASIRIALGELFCEEAELISRIGNQQLQEIILLERAITEGYGAAVQIDATNMDALVGLGEVYLVLSKHYYNLGEKENTRQSSSKSLQWYTKAATLLKEDTDNKYDFSFGELCDVMYNLAFSAGVSGQYDTSSRTFGQLMQMDSISASDLLADPDMESFRGAEWFLSLTQHMSYI